MKSYSNKFLLALLVIFISSCDPSSVALNKNALLGANESSLNKDSLLIDTERFIANKRDQVVATAETGPNIKNFMAQKASVRKQINKEVRKNNTDVDSNSSNSSNDVIFPITINFENISIKDMSIMFSEITGRNILIGDEVQGMVSAKLDNVPWDKALDSILKIKKLAKYVDDEANIIRIHSQAVLVEQEAYDLEIIEAMKKTKSAKNSSEPIYTEIFKLYYTKASQISTEIQSVLNSSSNEGESASDGLDITIDERLNYLIVKATKPELDLIETLIAELDVRT